MYFVEIDAKKVHSNLALRYFRQYFAEDEHFYHSFTINQPLSSMVYSLGKTISEDKPIFLASAYIWNVEIYAKLFELIKDIYPRALVLIGGPEVSYCDERWLSDSPFDVLIRGEGDDFFRELGAKSKIERYEYLKTLTIVDCADVENLDAIGMGYSLSEIADLHIAYYEASRGCPYSCSYCISSLTKGVRYKSLAVVKRELDLLFTNNVPIIKFIDRTFNAPVKRAIELMEYIKSIDNGMTTCHFELSPNLVNQALVETIAGARDNLFQFEIGIQTAKKHSLNAINRVPSMRDWSGVKALIALKNCHVHLDLIAGLPYESYTEFKESFNAVMALDPDHLQVGMLKMLKGTHLSNSAKDYGYAYSQSPPYEFYSNNFISIEEKLKLMALEEGTERLYNDDGFLFLLRYLNAKNIDMFEFYRSIGEIILQDKTQGLFPGKDKIVQIVMAEIAKYKEINSDLALNMIAADQLLAGIKPSGLVKAYSKTVDTVFSKEFYRYQADFPQIKKELSSKEISKQLKAIYLKYDFSDYALLDKEQYLVVFKGLKKRYLFDIEKGIKEFD